MTWDRLTTALVLGLNNLQRIPIHITLSALAVFSTFHAGLWSTNSADILFNSQLIKPSSLCSLLAISNTPLMHWMIKRKILCGVWRSLMHSYAWQKSSERLVVGIDLWPNKCLRILRILGSSVKNLLLYFFLQLLNWNIRLSREIDDDTQRPLRFLYCFQSRPIVHQNIQFLFILLLVVLWLVPLDVKSDWLLISNCMDSKNPRKINTALIIFLVLSQEFICLTNK